MIRFKCIIFDFDGTVTKPYFNFPEIKREIGMPNDRLILEYMEEQDEAFRKRAADILYKWEIKAAEEAELNDGMEELIIYLRQKNIKTAVLTRNCNKTVKIVLDKYPVLSFDYIATRDTEPLKPDPRAMLLLLNILNVKPDDALLIGDYEHDIECGRLAGTKTMYLTNGKSGYDLKIKPDFIVSNLHQALLIIKEYI